MRLLRIWDIKDIGSLLSMALIFTSQEILAIRTPTVSLMSMARASTCSILMPHTTWHQSCIPTWSSSRSITSMNTAPCATWSTVTHSCIRMIRQSLSPTAAMFPLMFLRMRLKMESPSLSVPGNPPAEACSQNWNCLMSLNLTSLLNDGWPEGIQTQ